MPNRRTSTHFAVALLLVGGCTSAARVSDTRVHAPRARKGWVAAAAIRVGDRPTAIAASINTIVVATDRELVEVDAASGAIRRRTGIAGPTLQIAIAGGAFWVPGSSGTLLRIDDRVHTSAVSDGLVAGSGSDLWVVGARSVRRALSSNLASTAQVAVRVTHPFAAASHSALWIADTDSSTLTRVAADDLSVRRVQLRGGALGAVATSATSVWVLHPFGAGTLDRIDQATLRTTATVAVGSGALGVTVDSRGDPWLVRPAHHDVVHVDATTNTVVETVRVDGEPAAVSVVNDELWIIDAAAGMLRHLSRGVTPAARVSALAEFYKPPDPLPAGEAGELIRSVRVRSIGDGRAWRILYHSRDRLNRDIAVSGYVVAPATPRPRTGWTVVSWAHPAAGLADQCAPSRFIDRGDLGPLGPAFLADGMVIAATDYEGLGTPGDPPFLDGISEARTTLDAARAARRLLRLGATHTVVVGHSQGGHAAIFAGQQAAAYAPDLDLVGVVAIAPDVELGDIFHRFADEPGATPAMLAAAYGLSRERPNTDIDSLLTAAARRALDQLRRRCVNAHAIDPPLTPRQAFAHDPTSTAPWTNIVRDNTPGRSRVATSVLVVQGDHDPTNPFVLAEHYVARARRNGTDVRMRIIAGADHATVIPAATKDITRWIERRAQ